MWESGKWMCVVKRQVSYRIFKQISHFQMPYVNTVDIVVFIRKDPTVYLWNITQLQLEKLDE